MYGGLNPPVLCCRTDNGGEFDAEFDMQLKQQRIRHERSLPRRPQTNARAERFHRTLAEGMRSLMLMSGLPYVFWAFCLAAFVYLDARSPTADGGESPFERRFAFHVASCRAARAGGKGTGPSRERASV